MWTSRGLESVSDYVIARKSTAKQCTDIRGYRGHDMGSDHHLLEARLTMNVLGKEKENNNNRNY